MPVGMKVEPSVGQTVRSYTYGGRVATVGRMTASRGAMGTIRKPGPVSAPRTHHKSIWNKYLYRHD